MAERGEEIHLQIISVRLMKFRQKFNKDAKRNGRPKIESTSGEPRCQSLCSVRKLGIFLGLLSRLYRFGNLRKVQKLKRSSEKSESILTSSNLEIRRSSRLIDKTLAFR